MGTMREYILWSNCNNCCKFCWQQKKQDITTFLKPEDMIKSIKTTLLELDKTEKGDDVLLVGGELFCSYGIEVDNAIKNLVDKCIDLLKKDIIRFVYINTNLLGHMDNRIYLLDRISQEQLEDRLKFTTSYDIYGRFANDKFKDNFCENLRYIREKYPKVNIVINIIITKQLAQSTEMIGILHNLFIKKFGARYINYIPYIPVEDDNSMNVTFRDIIKVLAAQEKIKPGYINRYIDDFDLNQNKILYEYHKDKGYVECTAKYAECHHNENFKKVLGDECYICKLKDVFR